jgi:hypothetical protein
MDALQRQLADVSNRTKVRIYKPADNPDDRVSLAGAPVQRDEEGRQFFLVPAHQAEYQAKLHPHYEVGDVEVEETKRGPGRPAKGE